MPNEATLAESSPAEAADVFNGQDVSMEEYSRYRQDGEVPERFKPAEDKAVDAPEQTVAETEIEPESEPDETQELPPKLSPAEKRIKQLLAENAELKRNQAAKPEVKPETAPVAAKPQYVHPKPTPEDKNPDGTLKYDSYEDVVEAIGRWAAKEERANWERETEAKQQQQSANAEIEEATKRYPTFKEVVLPAVSILYEDASIPLLVKQTLANSEIRPDLLYTLTSDPAEFAKFQEMARTNPGKAVRHIVLMENEINETLKGNAATGDEPPVKPQTKAPKPPAPVGGSSSRAFDVNDESLSADDWMRKRNADLAKKRA